MLDSSESQTHLNWGIMGIRENNQTSIDSNSYSINLVKLEIVGTRSIITV